MENERDVVGDALPAVLVGGRTASLHKRQDFSKGRVRRSAGSRERHGTYCGRLPSGQPKGLTMHLFHLLENGTQLKGRQD